MPTFQFQTRISENGAITIPPIAGWYGEKAEVFVLVPEKNKQEMAKPKKSPEQEFLDFCAELNMPPMTDEEIDQAKYDYLMEKYK